MEAVVTTVLDPPTGSATDHRTETPRRRLVGGCEGCPLQAEIFELRQQRGFYKERHQRACQREQELKRKIQELEAKLRLRERQLFGRKSEKSNSHKSHKSKPTISKPPNRPKGQQPGSTGHGRKDHSHLPAEEEIYALPEQDCQCPQCGRRLEEFTTEEFTGTEDSELIEIDVRPHRRVIRRKRYRPTCQCGKMPGIVTAPAPPKLIPKSNYGVSVWVTVLLDKYCFLRPTQRLVEDLKTHGLDLAPGTITGGLKKLAPLFEPVMEGIVAKILEDSQWHADETRWPVFIFSEGKVGFKWYLWVFKSSSAVAFVLDPSRAASVPEKFFRDGGAGILIVDRYAAYKALAKVKDGIILLAFCWAHVRRDFLGVAKDWPDQESWGLEWVTRIGGLFHLNKERLKVLEKPTAFAPRDQELREAVEQMAKQRDEELSQSNLHPARKKALESLRNHWKGLVLFVDHPQIPMDNSEAERQMRPPAVARKNFYGSGALWAGNLAARLFSLFATLKLWKLNPRKWLTTYLQACADHGGKAPQDVDRFLPWNMSEQQRDPFVKPATIHHPP